MTKRDRTVEQMPSTVIVFESKVEEQLHKVLLVFSHNASQQTVYQPYVVWRVLHLEGRAVFAYPRDFGVGITWTYARHGRRKESSRVGPFATVAGSVWQATQHGSEAAEVTLTEVSQESRDEVMEPARVVVHSVAPQSKDRFPIHCGVYKSGLLFMERENIPTGEATEFIMDDQLHFALVPSSLKFREGTKLELKDLTLLEAHKVVNLKQHPRKVHVVLSRNQQSGSLQLDTMGS